MSGKSRMKQSTRPGNLSDTMMTWGSDFSTLLPTVSLPQRVSYSGYRHGKYCHRDETVHMNFA